MSFLASNLSVTIIITVLYFLIGLTKVAQQKETLEFMDFKSKIFFPGFPFKIKTCNRLNVS